MRRILMNFNHEKSGLLRKHTKKNMPLLKKKCKMQILNKMSQKD